MSPAPSSLCILIPYFGKTPKYLPFFLESCSKNNFIDFFIFTDDKDALKYDGNNINIRIFYQKVNEFEQLATEKLGTPFVLKKAYKLCDIKPMYGKIFEDYIREYQFWGFSDVDIILGDLRKLLTNELLAACDIISFYDVFISGPFCLFRNVQEINTLYRKSKDIDIVLQDSDHFCFDEAAGMDIIWKLWKGTPILETDPLIESFSHIVLNPQKCNKRLHFQKWITDSNLTTEVIHYQNGQLFMDGKEIYLYHYLWNKGSLTFNAPPYKKGANFVFTKHGFFYGDIKSKTIDWFFCFLDNIASKIIKKLKRYLQ